MTIKTHEAAGLVVPRALHCSTGHSYAPVFRFIADVCKTYLKGRHHILRDSIDFVTNLSGHRIPAEHVFVKGDVENCFMSGQHVDLAASASNAWSRPQGKQEYTELAEYILSSQYVLINKFGTIHRVRKGTGMGLIHSGEFRT